MVKKLGRQYTSQELGKWMLDKAKLASGAAARKIILNTIPNQRDDTVIGKMFFFKYDPLFPDKMPKFDMFPLVFPIEHYPTGANGPAFLGLNLHYLTVEERKVILGRLLQYRTNTRMDKTTRLRVSYQLLDGTKHLSTEMRPCIHRYLYHRVRSPFIEVPADEWSKAIEVEAADWYYNI